MFSSVFRAQGNGGELSGKFRLHIGKRLSLQRVARHWNKLPRGVAVAPNLSELQEGVETLLDTWCRVRYSCQKQRWMQCVPSHVGFSLILLCPQDSCW